MVVPPAHTPFNWSGVYFGGHVGWAHTRLPSGGCSDFSNFRGDEGEPGPPALECELVELDGNGPALFPAFDLDGDYIALIDGFNGHTNNGWFFGGQVGINRQYGSMVLGLEMDGSWFHGDAGEVGRFQYWHDYNGTWDELEFFEGEGVVTSKLDWLTTFRGRVGAAMGTEGRFLPYLTGGLAVGKSTISGSFSDESSIVWANSGPDEVDWCGDGCFFEAAKTSYQVGHALGAGIEYAHTNNITVGLEYMYVGFWNNDSITFHGDDGRSFDVKGGVDHIHSIKAKVNFLFP